MPSVFGVYPLGRQLAQVRYNKVTLAGDVREYRCPLLERN
jgi:hypothetical protein